MKWLEFITLSLAVASISITITKSVAFERFRWWLEDKGSRTIQGGLGKTTTPRLGTGAAVYRWFHELFTCPYCLSHWISFIIIAIYRPKLLPLTQVPLITYFLEALALVTLAAFWGAILIRAFVIKK